MIAVTATNIAIGLIISVIILVILEVCIGFGKHAFWIFPLGMVAASALAVHLDPAKHILKGVASSALPKFVPASAIIDSAM